MEGHVKLHRKILSWEWYSDINTSRLFIHMLLVANWKEQKFRGITIPRGSFVSSIPKLSEETGLSIQEIKTALSHLKSTGEVTGKTIGKYTIFIINNYHLYQQDNRQTNLQSTDNQPGSNLEATGLKKEEEKKEIKQEKNINTMCKIQEARELFERLWKLYPNKRGKGQVNDAQKQRLLAVGESALVKAIERYSTELQKDASWRKPQNGSTFFSSGYVDYLNENYVPGKETASLSSSSASKNRFNNFDQRETDYDALMMQKLQARMNKQS